MTFLPRAITESPSEELGSLSVMLETALDAVVVMHADGRIDGWNAQAEATFGWSHAEAIGRCMGDLIVPHAHRTAHSRGLQRYLSSGHGPVLRRRIEITALRKNGAEFPIELSICPVTTAGAQVFVGFIRDISDRRRSEELLQRQLLEATLLHRVTSLAAGTATFDDVLRDCLAAVCELTGWPAGHAYLPTSAPIQLVPTSMWHGPADKYADFRKATRALIFAPGEGLPGEVWDRGGPVWVPDLSNAPSLRRAGQARAEGFRAAFAFPLKAGNEIIAILEFFCETHAEPDKNTLLVIQTMGDQVGRVIERRLAEDKFREEIEHRKKVEAHQQLLLAELNHRVKNMLAVVAGIATQTARTNTSIAEFSERFLGRIKSLARGFDLLTAGSWTPTALHAIVCEVITPHLADADRQLAVSGPDIALPPRPALALSMILHELVTNAAKYGALAAHQGKIEVEWTIGDARSVKLRWQEFGARLDAHDPGTRTAMLNETEDPRKMPARSGFGTQFIKASVRHELGGSLTRSLEAGGMLYRFEFPFEAVLGT